MDLGVGSLEAASFRNPVRLNQVRCWQRRGAERADLSAAHEVGHHRERLLDVRIRVRAVQLVDIDVVGLQAAQGVLDRCGDPAAGAALVTRVGVDGATDLCSKDDVVTAALEC